MHSPLKLLIKFHKLPLSDIKEDRRLNEGD